METRDIMRRYALLLLLLASLWASRAQAQSERLVLVLTATGPLTPAMIEYLDRGVLVGGQGEDLGQTIERKEKEILKATVRGLAGRRGGTAVALAEATIEEAKAASAQEALEAGLIDVIAEDVEELGARLDGFPVELQAGGRTLHTGQASIEHVGQSFIEQLLGALTNPNIVFLLMAVGVQAGLIGAGSPGGWAAGLVGGACLSLGALGLGVLPVNWFGTIFIATAFVLFILDIKAPTHGALTAAGTACFIVGSLVLFNSPRTPAFFQA